MLFKMRRNVYLMAAVVMCISIAACSKGSATVSGSVIRGDVSRAWAKKHHDTWYEQLLRDSSARKSRPSACSLMAPRSGCRSTR